MTGTEKRLPPRADVSIEIGDLIRACLARTNRTNEREVRCLLNRLVLLDDAFRRMRGRCPWMNDLRDARRRARHFATTGIYVGNRT